MKSTFWKTSSWLAAVSLMSVTVPLFAQESDAELRSYQDVIQQTAGMRYDSEAQRLAEQYGLQILDLTWEDTGRYKNSSVGPNISDMTIQVQRKDPVTGQYALTCMPVIRFPNFSDRTGDVPLDKFYLLVGNEKGRRLRRITLRDFLSDMRAYLHDPGSWKGSWTSLLTDRDTHVLASAQACFLPISQNGTAEFNPVLFNYQSVQNDPAVLTLLVTREGTSVTVIDNARDPFEAGRTWGQRLFFNQNGERSSLTGQRISHFLGTVKTGQADNGKSREKGGLNMVMLIQVPLKQKNPMRTQYACDSVSQAAACGVMLKEACERKADVENAVIGHGKVEGPFTEIGGLEIERDPSFPIRVTVQFYKATSNGLISEPDMKEIADQIGKVYSQADYVGSLVVGGETHRPTEYVGDKNQPAHWWAEFWKRFNESNGQEPPAWGILSDNARGSTSGA